MSLFEGLQVATRGLAAAQLGLSVTGQNLTNASTEGYSRKRIEQSAEWKKDGTYGQMGFGVEVYSINRIRDQFVDRLVNEEYTRYGYYSIKDASYTRIEDIFNEPKKDALNNLMNTFWNSWMDVSNNPKDLAAREILRQNTETMTNQFHYVMAQLRSYKNTINDEIEDRVHRINELTEGIHHCNMVIATTENTIGNKANDTRDQRDKLLSELAQLVDVDYFEEENGAIIVSSSGHMLVSNAKNHELGMNRVEITEMDGYQYSKVEVTSALTGLPFIPKQGELRALMDVRDVDIPKYEQYMNELAKTMITEVNKLHQNGYGLNGLTYIDFFDRDPSKLNAANITLAQAIRDDLHNIAAGEGGIKRSVQLGSLDLSTNPPTPTDYIPIGQLWPPPGNDLLNQYSSITFNLTSRYEFDSDGDSTPDYRYDGDQNPDYRYIYKNSLEIGYWDLENPTVFKVLQEGKDYDIDYNTAQITFKYSATGPLSDPAGLEVIIRFDHHATGFAGPDDEGNARLISQLRDKAMMQADIFGNSSQSMGQFYSGMLGRLGTERNEAASGLQTRIYALDELKRRQDEIMGVEINEEIANLIQYQHTYQASARYLTTINTMLETLLNM
ncbi:MAG: flagellar hook-associated protein FlgK [Candidatus Fibromonas sp.]|jgi:flagellar hook-associated protein 1 FlgK|nr:flagellar hook-associated protein FlgK [Candidatus Fibromonas sp.]